MEHTFRDKQEIRFIQTFR